MNMTIWCKTVMTAFCFSLFLASESTAAMPDTYRNSIGMEFVLIPAGSFMMGADRNFEKGDDDEFPRHQVKLSKPFYLGTYEVTQKQWHDVMGTNPSSFKDRNRPVEQISWPRAQEFIKKLNEKEGHNRYRLPTEAEWEYAARAGSDTAYPFGDHPEELAEYAWYRDNSGGMTHPGGLKKPNPWGLHDMIGNVQEWVQDMYAEDYYASSPEENPKGTESSSIYRVSRGGSWYNDARQTRPAERIYYHPDDSYYFLGLRVAMDPED